MCAETISKYFNQTNILQVINYHHLILALMTLLLREQHV